MNKTFWVALGLAAVVSSSLAFTNDKEEPKYKNLKILPKNITHEQLDSVMDHFTASLNVKCNFCHIRNEATKEWDWPSDGNKHKLVAREMMKMTYKINDKYFELPGGAQNLNARLNVTCFTCHNGRKEPLSIPPQKEETPKAPANNKR